MTNLSIIPVRTEANKTCFVGRSLLQLNDVLVDGRLQMTAPLRIGEPFDIISLVNAGYQHRHCLEYRHEQDVAVQAFAIEVQDSPQSAARYEVIDVSDRELVFTRHDEESHRLILTEYVADLATCEGQFISFKAVGTLDTQTGETRLSVSESRFESLYSTGKVIGFVLKPVANLHAFA